MDLQRRHLGSGRKVALVNIDCDIYKSAVLVFKFLDPLFQEGSVMYIDDLSPATRAARRKGRGAFLEWQQCSRWKIVHRLDVGWWGRSDIVYLDKEGAVGVL